MVDFMNCHTGCVSGGGVHNRGHNSYNIIVEYQKKRREAFSKQSNLYDTEDNFIQLKLSQKIKVNSKTDIARF